MNSNYDWYAGWGWLIWFGFIMLIFSNAGTWGYTYTSHRKTRDLFSGKDSLDFLTERYAKGEIGHDQYLKIKDEIFSVLERRSNHRRPMERQALTATNASI